MSFLTDTDLSLLICSDKDWADKNKLYIYPYEKECLTPAGYDVRIGSRYASALDASICNLSSDDCVTIKPTDTVLITTLENIGMPQNHTISAFITSKVSKVSKGLSHISTNIDADWRGNLLIAIHNPSHRVVKLKYGEPFCTLNFIENKSPSTKESHKDPGRTDILLEQFIQDVKISKELETNKNIQENRINLLIKIGIILVFGIIGYIIFSSTPGFIALAAMGVGISSFIKWPKVN
jgi:deoxycytidine triphosphate deaminase